MALPHARPGEVIDLQAPDPEAPVSTSLLRTDAIQLLRLVLSAGQQIPAHQVPGPITIQALSGEALVETPDGPRRLAAGQLLALSGGTRHALCAITPSVVLVTVLHPAP